MHSVRLIFLTMMVMVMVVFFFFSSTRINVRASLELYSNTNHNLLIYPFIYEIYAVEMLALARR